MTKYNVGDILYHKSFKVLVTVEKVNRLYTLKPLKSCGYPESFRFTGTITYTDNSEYVNLATETELLLYG